MRHSRVELHENIPRDIFALGNEYTDGLVLPPHSHRRCQCLYAIKGVLTVRSSQGSWVVPPRRASWIPAGVAHEVRMNGHTITRSAYINPDVARHAGAFEHCTVIEVSPLLHELLTVAVDVPTLYPLGGREDHLMQLLVEEIAQMVELPLNAPLPTDPRLASLCHGLLQAPSLEVQVDHAASRVGMSRRNFTRLFREQTGMSFADWRQQACLLSALTQLGLGQSVTHVAMELGYSNTSAFTAAFRRILGVPPSHYLANQVAT